MPRVHVPQLVCILGPRNVARIDEASRVLGILPEPSPETPYAMSPAWRSLSLASRPITRRRSSSSSSPKSSTSYYHVPSYLGSFRVRDTASLGTYPLASLERPIQPHGVLFPNDANGAPHADTIQRRSSCILRARSSKRSAPLRSLLLCSVCFPLLDSWSSHSMSGLARFHRQRT